MASASQLVQTHIITLLQASNALNGVNIRGDDDDGTTINIPHRITVSVGEYSPKLSARSELLPPAVLQATVTITGKTNANQSTFDGWRDAVDAVILANGTNSNVMLIQDQAGESTMGEQRSFTRTCTAMFRIA